MTEAEWLAGTDPAPMLEFLEGKVSDRKLQLLGCECCRRVWDKWRDDERAWLEASEDYVEGRITREELAEAWTTFSLGWSDLPERYGHEEALWDLRAASARSVSAHNETAAQIRLVYCVIGNPFRPITAGPRWLTPTVTGLATTIYAERASTDSPSSRTPLRRPGAISPPSSTTAGVPAPTCGVVGSLT